MGKSVECSDPETGEHIGLGILIEQKKRRRGIFRKGFSMIADEQLEAVALDRELCITDMRVLFLVAANMGYQNKAKLHQMAICKKLGMAPAQVSRSCKRLVEKGLLDCAEFGKMKIYAVNRKLAFKGRIGEKPAPE